MSNFRIDKRAGDWRVTLDACHRQYHLKIENSDSRVTLGKVFDEGEIRDLAYALSEVLRGIEADK